MDLLKNTSKYGWNQASQFPYFLQITDVLNHFTVLLGLSEVSSSAIFDCLCHYAIWFKPNSTFKIGNVDNVHADAGTAFKFAEFVSDCEQHGIKVTFAAPCHQVQL